MTLTSLGRLPDEMRTFRDHFITWTIKWGAWEHEVAPTGQHTVFSTNGYAEDVTDLHAILRLTEDGAPHEDAKTIDCLDTLIQDRSATVSTGRSH